MANVAWRGAAVLQDRIAYGETLVNSYMIFSKAIGIIFVADNISRSR